MGIDDVATSRVGAGDDPAEAGFRDSITTVRTVVDGPRPGIDELVRLRIRWLDVDAIDDSLARRLSARRAAGISDRSTTNPSTPGTSAVATMGALGAVLSTVPAAAGIVVWWWVSAVAAASTVVALRRRAADPRRLRTRDYEPLARAWRIGTLDSDPDATEARLGVAAVRAVDRVRATAAWNSPEPTLHHASLNLDRWLTRLLGQAEDVRDARLGLLGGRGVLPLLGPAAQAEHHAQWEQIGDVQRTLTEKIAALDAYAAQLEALDLLTRMAGNRTSLERLRRDVGVGTDAVGVRSLRDEIAGRVHAADVLLGVARRDPDLPWSL